MKKDNFDELRPEYHRDDLGQGERGKFYNAFKSSNNLVLLTPDVAEMSDDEESVNNALRTLIKLAKKSIRTQNTNKVK